LEALREVRHLSLKPVSLRQAASSAVGEGEQAISIKTPRRRYSLSMKNLTVRIAERKG
jgi:hypothetical protein